MTTPLQYRVTHMNGESKIYTVKEMLAGQIPRGFLDVSYLRVDDDGLRVLCEDSADVRDWPWAEAGPLKGKWPSWKEFVKTVEQYLVEHEIDPTEFVIDPKDFPELLTGAYWRKAGAQDVADRIEQMKDERKRLDAISELNNDERIRLVNEVLENDELQAMIRERLGVPAVQPGAVQRTE